MRTVAALALGLMMGLTISSFARQGAAPAGQGGGQRGGGQPQPSITVTTVVTASDVAAKTANANLIRLVPYNINLEVRNMLDGKQYVAFLGGQGMVLPPLPNAPPPAPGAVPGNAASVGGTAPPKLLTFVLDGKGMVSK